MYTHFCKYKKKELCIFYSHGSFFIVTNFETWVYKETKIHFLLETLNLSWIDFLEIFDLAQMPALYTTHRSKLCDM